jgi:hypothetical protein
MSIKFVDPNALALISALIAMDLAQGLDLEEQNVLGNFIIDVGQILVTMAAAREARKKAADEKAAETKAAETKAAETKTAEAAEQPGKPAETKQDGETQPVGGKQSTVDEDEFIGRDWETLERRIAGLERQIRLLTEARDRKRES